jgi:hypothetical protein
MTVSTSPPTLYVVATPIGNLGDLSPRARGVLQSVVAICAEDTRHTRQLLAHFGLDTPLVALHEHNEDAAVDGLVARLLAGESLALVSDAGTPLVSDPGFRLVRAARNAGIFVPNETVEACIEYVKRSQNPDGGFMYMLSGGPSQFPRSAAGVVALYSAGIYEGDEIEKGLEYLMQHVPKDDAFSRESHYFYGQYYAAQAMFLAGGTYWRDWYPAIRRELIGRQKPDGRWSGEVCDEYCTAIALIVLQMPNRYLPVFSGKGPGG